MSTSRIATIAILLLMLLGGLFVYFNHKSWDEETRVASFLAVFLLGGILAAILVFMHVLPWIGDAVGGFFYSSGEEVSDDGSNAAVAKLAQGDYAGAIAEYEKLRAENPDEAFNVGEIAKIHADKLEDPDAGIAYLTEAIEGQEWSEDGAGLLLVRMVDIHAGALDFASAKSVLEQTMEALPGTRHSANANHRLQQLEEEEFKAKQQQHAEEMKEEALGSDEDSELASGDSAEGEDGRL